MMTKDDPTFAQFLGCLPCLSGLKTLVEHVDHPLLIVGDAEVLKVDVSNLLGEINLCQMGDSPRVLLG